MRNILELGALTFFLGCSSVSNLDPYQEGIKTALQQMNESKRKLSSEEKFSARNLKALEMLLFPKAFKFNLKSKDEEIDYNALEKMNEEEKKIYFSKRVEYLKPLEFQINPLISDLCVNLASKSGSKYDSYEFLTGRRFNPSEKCLVVEVKRKLPKAFGKKVLEVRKDDLLKIFIYLSESLKPYGKKVFLAVQSGRERFREVDILMSENDTLSSELDLIPVEIPNPSNFAIRNNIKSFENSFIRIPKDLFVVASINKELKSTPCEKGFRLDYLDVFKNEVQIDWCFGDSWPKTINTPRFFAIKK